MEFPIINKELNTTFHMNLLNMNGIAYPVAVKDVPKFGKQNDISVNVFGYEEGSYPLYISRNQKKRHVNLLLIEKG